MSRGRLLFLPRGVPHGFRVDSATPARVLQISAPAGIERAFVELGEPAQELALPIRRGVRDGPRPAFLVQLGAVLVALTVGGAVLLGLAPVLTHPTVRLPLTLLSASLLLGLAWSTLRAACCGSDPRRQPPSERHSVLMGSLCAASNPLMPMTWLTVAGVVATAEQDAPWPTPLAIAVTGYLLGALVWAVLIAGTIGWSRTLVQPRVVRWWNMVSGVALAAYGMHLLWITLLSR